MFFVFFISLNLWESKLFLFRHQGYAETAVLITGMDAATVTKGTAAVRCTKAPAAAPLHAIVGFLVIQRVVPFRICGVVVFIIPVLTPFPNVATHVENTQFIGCFGS